MKIKNFYKIALSLLLSLAIGIIYYYSFGENNHKFYITSSCKNLPTNILEESISQFFNTYYPNKFIIKSNDSLAPNTIKTIVFLKGNADTAKIARQLSDFIQSSSIAYNFCKTQNIKFSYKINGIYEKKTPYNSALWDSISISVLSLLLILIAFYYKHLLPENKEDQ
jgi:hypothetical protein